MALGLFVSSIKAHVKGRLQGCAVDGKEHCNG